MKISPDSLTSKAEFSSEPGSGVRPVTHSRVARYADYVTYVTTLRRPFFEGVISGAQPGDLPLTVQLVDAAGNVLATGPVAANGTFSLALPQDLNNGAQPLWARAVDR